MLDYDVVSSREEGCDLDGFQNATYEIWISVLFEETVHVRRTEPLTPEKQSYEFVGPQKKRQKTRNVPATSISIRLADTSGSKAKLARHPSHIVCKFCLILVLRVWKDGRHTS